ncbi:uncharacterized protein LOC110897271 isoform X3 [Helianthus annuus]|uniref:uncharacterized protein LOC110897271 isoform X3 n=1 Tax=Helianthus annuus TaxID=4232 RepID=UPI000B8FDE33|nr:uncharacterized protein LOC110897271 isoform X3 [Helianthus annuus]XP_035844869.1 uncharacterized protein LOC110897271 isoform X3 [Helianthus annuus]
MANCIGSACIEDWLFVGLYPFLAFSPSEIIRDHLGLSCCNVDCKFLVDEEYAQNIKIERSGNKFFFSRDWVKVVQQIKMKFATFVLFQYMGQRKYKLIVFMNDSTQLIVSHPQANPKAAHDMNTLCRFIINLFHKIIKSFLLLPSLQETDFVLPTKMARVARVTV